MLCICKDLVCDWKSNEFCLLHRQFRRKSTYGHKSCKLCLLRPCISRSKCFTESGSRLQTGFWQRPVFNRAAAAGILPSANLSESAKICLCRCRRHPGAGELVCRKGVTFLRGHMGRNVDMWVLSNFGSPFHRQLAR